MNEPNPNDEERQPRIREESLCPCKSKLPYKECCMPYHYGRAKAETAEALMRSRYSAFFFRRIDYILDTTYPRMRTAELQKSLEENMRNISWSFLRILSTSKGQKHDKVGKVEFVADYYLNGECYEMHEHSRFKRHKGAWKYVDDKG
ncbi:YchJ family metal-binding protein [Kiritimatiellota bacterium B12222]|nr:YchJ family metal-binding protein [Kiritimatiellota bacterium B12222]